MGAAPDELFALVVDNVDDEGALLVLIDVDVAITRVAEVGMTAEWSRAGAEVVNFSLGLGDYVEGNSKICLSTILRHALGGERLAKRLFDSAINDRAEHDVLIIGAHLAAINYEALICSEFCGRRTIIIDGRGRNAA